MAPSGNDTVSPCGACKFLRRKCAADCIFAPYFCSDEDGPARFAAIHKVFGASNASKLLSHVAVPCRSDAVVTIAYEAQARITDPVYGCVAHILALQQQVAFLQAQLMQVKAQVVQNLMKDATTNYTKSQLWTSTSGSNNGVSGSLKRSLLVLPNYDHMTNYIDSIKYMISPQSSIESIDRSFDTFSMREIQSRDQQQQEQLSGSCDSSDLQAIALSMIRN